VPRRFVRNIRAILHNCEKQGLLVANARFQIKLDKKSRKRGPPPLLNHLRGKLDYLAMVRGNYDALYVKLATRAHSITPMFKYGVQSPQTLQISMISLLMRSDRPRKGCERYRDNAGNRFFA
jgi:hypothetical protein